jgi:hypothetical protein
MEEGELGQQSSREEQGKEDGQGGEEDAPLCPWSETGARSVASAARDASTGVDSRASSAVVGSGQGECVALGIRCPPPALLLLAVSGPDINDDVKRRSSVLQRLAGMVE